MIEALDKAVYLLNLAILVSKSITQHIAKAM